MDLAKFCGAGKLALPFTRGAYTWATDGRLMVRVPADAGIPDNPAAPDAAKVFGREWAPGEWLPVPFATPPDSEECAYCHGDGVRECDMGHQHDCDYCDGTGKVTPIETITVGNAHYQRRYLALIQGWEISPRGMDKPACIRCGETVGLLMPCRP